MQCLTEFLDGWNNPLIAGSDEAVVKGISFLEAPVECVLPGNGIPSIVMKHLAAILIAPFLGAGRARGGIAVLPSAGKQAYPE